MIPMSQPPVNPEFMRRAPIGSMLIAVTALRAPRPIAAPLKGSSAIEANVVCVTDDGTVALVMRRTETDIPRTEYRYRPPHMVSNPVVRMPGEETATELSGKFR